MISTTGVVLARSCVCAVIRFVFMDVERGCSGGRSSWSEGPRIAKLRRSLFGRFFVVVGVLRDLCVLKRLSRSPLETSTGAAGRWSRCNLGENGSCGSLMRDVCTRVVLKNTPRGAYWVFGSCPCRVAPFLLQKAKRATSGTMFCCGGRLSVLA